MSEHLATLQQQYKDAMAIAKDVSEQMLAAYTALTTVDERFKMVLEFGDEFLGHETYYCEHLELENGDDVSLYDDLYWEKYETKNLNELFMGMIESHYDTYVYGTDAVRAKLLEDPVAVLNQDTPAAAVARNFLEKGLRSAEFNW